MSSAASRQRHRRRRRARERVWEAQKELAERQVDLVSYERVLADMTTKRKLSPFGGAIAIQIVTIGRDVARHDCEQLSKTVDALKSAADALEPTPEATV